ncbi:DNA-(apurinic or apyrimidinic site) lyase [Elasticomyces elasticus]|nr:DNA-(apurinic or apyrimidinic site) lyase [Elasticomyces elasticus]
MAKRKIVEETSEDSALSPPPKDLDQAVAGANGHAEEESERPAKKRRTKQTTTKVETVVSDESAKPAKKITRVRKVKIEVVEEAQGEQTKEATPKKSRARKVKDEDEVDENGEPIEKKPKAKRKSKADKERELVEMPLAARTIGHKLLIGAHVSAAGGVQQSILNSVHIGANAFALFLKSQRKWENPPLLDSACTAFHANCTTHTYDANATRTTQAYNSFIDDLKRCERLGITLYNFHPGTDQCSDRPKAIAHLASNINRAHAETRKVVTLLETMTAGGNTIGCSFEDLASIISLVTNKDRVGVCLDTAHVFTAGYDLRTPEAFKSTMDELEKVVGFKYLRALHLNDSKAPFRSNKDLHANIGTGFLGLRAFHNIVNEHRFAGLPLVLETPIEVRDDDGILVKDEKGKEQEDKGIWAREIKLLESLMGMDVESEEFLDLERSLARKGEPERRRLEEQIERVKEKAEKKAQNKRKPKAKKGVKVDEDGGGSDDESVLSEVDSS